jgi:hypothetical protein
MAHIRDLHRESKMNLTELGVAMGYASHSARQGAHRFLNSPDPTISALRRFAAAIGVPLSRLIE